LLDRVDVAAAGVFNSPGPADIAVARQGNGAFERTLDRFFVLVRKLEAIGPEQLDAVIVIGVVAGRDHDAEVGAHFTGKQRHGRRVSLPMMMRCLWVPRRKWRPAACPTFIAVAASRTPSLARPRIPSVPKYLRPIRTLTSTADCHAASRLQCHVPVTQIKMPAGLTFAALLAGLAAGWALSNTAAADTVAAVASPVGTIWLRGLQMTIVPLVAALLVTGIVRMVATAQAGKMARRTLLTILAILAA